MMLGLPRVVRGGNLFPTTCGASVIESPESATWHRRWIWRLSVLVASLAFATVQADDRSVRVGWDGECVVGRWTGVAVDFDVPEAGSYELRLIAPDPDGHQVSFVSHHTLTAGRQTLQGHFKVGALADSIRVEVWKQGATAATREAVAPIAVLTPDTRLVLTLGKPAGFEAVESDGSTRFRILPLASGQLPNSVQAYDAVYLVALAGAPVVTEAQAAALRDWVARGGRLFVSLPRDSAADVLRPMSGWFPVSLGPKPITVSEFGKLEFYAGKNIRIPLRGRMAIPSLRVTHGEVLAGSRDEPLLVRAPSGAGSVTVLALDLTQPPLIAWPGLPALCQKLLATASELSASTAVRNQQLSTTGITDLATQLHSIQDQFPDVARPSPWTVLGLIGLFLVIIGPMDYVLCHRVLKRPQATWFTLPVWVVLTMALSVSAAGRWNGERIRINQLNLITYDVASTTLHQRLLSNVYSPVTRRATFGVASALETPETPVQTGWSGIPESVFGGMLRPAGVPLGATRYEVTSRKVLDLPLLQWSSKALTTEIHGSAAFVESDLQSNGIGQLSGSIQHRFPGPIEDWLLAYGNRVYRYKKTRDAETSLPLPALQVLRMDQPNIYPRELRAYLTGRTTVPSGAVRESSHQYQPYDVLSLNPDDAVQILTFHDVAGGAKYTGLTNRLLDHEDLSHQLKLGRAILFGRLATPIARIELDGAPVNDVREVNYVRVILPVSSVRADVVRPLERFE